MFRFLLKTKETLLDIVFPPICVMCSKNLASGEKEKSICAKCFDLIPISNTLICPECGARLARNIKICHKNTSYRLLAASTYNNELIKNTIWKLKYEKKTYAAKTLSAIIILYIKYLNLKLDNYYIIPVPLHKNKERERGFNQAELIAKNISSNFNLPIIPNALKRIKNTKPQADTKNFEEREKNMENSFVVKNTALVEGKNILLLDDVFTSGSTINEAVKTLKYARVNKIIALVAAKAGF